MNKNVSLEFLRIVFFFQVFFYHFGAYETSNLYACIFYRGGVQAVSSFFILAGFVASMKEVNKEYFNIASLIKTFFLKVKKVYPLHIIFLFLGTILNRSLIGKNRRLFLVSLFANITLTQSWFNDISVRYSFNGVAWYLSTYLFCQMMVPVLRFLYYKIDLSAKRTLIIMILLLFMDTLFSVILKEESRFYMYTYPPIRFIDFTFGFCLYRISKEVNITGMFASIFEILFFSLYIFFMIFSKKIPDFICWSTIYLVPSALLIFIFSKDSGVISKLIKVRENIVFYFGNQTLFYYVSHQIIMAYSVIILRKLKINNNFSILIMTLLIIGSFGWLYNMLLQRRSK